MKERVKLHQLSTLLQVNLEVCLKEFWKCILLNRAPTSTKVPPPPSSSTRFHPPPPSSLQYPQQYSNQNIAHIWAIFPNLGQIIQSCPLWLKIGSHGILEVLIPNPDLDFEILTQKPFFGQIWSQKVKVVCFVWTLTHMVSQGCWFLFQHQLSEILPPKLIFS